MKIEVKQDMFTVISCYHRVIIAFLLPFALHCVLCCCNVIGYSSFIDFSFNFIVRNTPKTKKVTDQWNLRSISGN